MSTTERLSGVDLLRGSLLLLMTMSHLPIGWAGGLGQPLGFISAAEGFVFVSAFLASSIFMRRYQQRGAAAATRWVYQRALRVYLCHMALIVLAFTVIAWLASHYQRPAVMNLLDFYFRDPALASLSALMLVYQPPLLDILPMYVLFLLITAPMLLLAGRFGWRWILGASFALWAFAQFGLRPWVFQAVSHSIHLRFGWEIPLTAIGAFDLFAWQLLWILGLWFGDVGMDRLRSALQAGNGLLIVGVLLSLALFVWRHTSGPEGFTDMGRHFFWIDKWTLSPIRLLNLGALLCVFVGLGQYLAPLRKLSLVESLGRSSLWGFVAHLCSVMLLLLLIDQSEEPLHGVIAAGAILFAYGALFTTAAVHQRRSRNGSE